MKKIAVYGGSFDPPTNGHLWMINKGMELFDHLVIAVGINPEKKSWLKLEEKVELLKRIANDQKRAEVRFFEKEYLIDFAKSIQAQFLLRGIRSASDYEYERQMCYINSDIGSSITTVFLMPPRDQAEISSSLVRGLIGPNGWQELIGKYVPSLVLAKIIEKGERQNG